MSNLQKKEKKYWFPAKKHGWGWGLPSVWQGWLVLIIYLGLIALSAYIYPPKVEAGPFVFLVIVFSVGFFGSLLDQRRTTALALGETIRPLSYH